MGPGNRADWAVRCAAGTHAFESGGVRRLEEIVGRRLQKGQGQQQATMVQTLATVIATDQGDANCDLSTFAVARPCYAADLQAATADESTNLVIGPAPRINNAEYSSSTTYVEHPRPSLLPSLF